MNAAVAICHESEDLWKVERANGLGGSDAPQILGISPFGGPASVAASKLGFRVEDVDSELLEWGHYVEEPLIQRFYAETGIAGKRSGVLYRSTDPATPWLQCTADAEIAGEPFGIQCKNAIFSASAWDEGVPDYVGAQVQHEMAVTGWTRIYVLVLLRGYQFRWAAVERDERFIAETLLPAEADFWHRLHAGQPIAPVGAPDREWEALKARFPRPEVGKSVPLPGADWIGLVARWRETKDAENEYGKAAKALRNTIVAALGDAEFGILDDGTRVSAKVSPRAGYTVAPTTSRTLRLVGSKS